MIGAEWVAIYITVIGAAGTAFNLWISLRIKTVILQLKLDISKEYVTKEDLQTTLAPMRESIQLVWSRRSARERQEARDAN